MPLTQIDSQFIFREIQYTLRRAQVKTKTLSAPPGAPAEGDRYIVKATGTGAWTDKNNQIAEWHSVEGAAAAWIFMIPWKGFTTWVEDENINYRWNGSAWIALPGTSPSATGTPYYEKHIVTAGEAASGIIPLIVDTYTVGNNSLCAYRNGMLNCITEDYLETNSSTVTFGAAVLETGDILLFRWAK